MVKNQKNLINDLMKNLDPKIVQKHVDEMFAKYKNIEASAEEIEEAKELAKKTYIKEHTKFINELVVKNKQKEKNRSKNKKSRKMSCRNKRKGK